MFNWPPCTYEPIPSISAAYTPSNGFFIISCIFTFFYSALRHNKLHQQKMEFNDKIARLAILNGPFNKETNKLVPISKYLYHRATDR